MRRLIAALALALLPVAPAWADWGATQWGMTLEEVLDAIPEARPLVREGNGGDVWGHHRLASMPWQEGDFPVTADFYFDPATQKLAFVKMQPNEVLDCSEMEKMFARRYGKGAVDQRDIGNFRAKATRWVDPKTKERLLFSTMGPSGQAPNYCHFIQQQPA